MGSVVLPHLTNGWQVDQSILTEEERLVVIRFGRDWDGDCMRQDEVLYRIADRVKNFAVIYVCDLDQVPDFKQMYELYDPMTIMFFFRNKHMMCDFGTGNNNKLNWVLEDKQELVDIIETIYKGAKKGRGLVVSPKGEWKDLLVFVSCDFLLIGIQTILRGTDTRPGRSCVICGILPHLWRCPSLHGSSIRPTSFRRHIPTCPNLPVLPDGLLCTERDFGIDPPGNMAMIANG